MPSDPAPPTVEQLRDLLDSVREARATRERGGSRTHFVFSVDNETLSAIGGSFYADGPSILLALREALGRLAYVDEVTKQYTGSDQKGTTAADCQAFIANELKHVPPTHDLASNMRRRMYNATLQKLVELGMWRAAIDAKRFQEQREAERKRQEDLRRQQEEMAESIRKQQERMREQAERARRESAAGAERDAKSRKRSGFENPFGDDFQEFWKDFNFQDNFSSDFAEAFRRSQRKAEEEAFYGGTSSNRRQEEQKQKTKARNKGRAPWFEVLGVPPNADKATIKSAYRKLASKFHPDRNSSPEAAALMKDINTAKDEGLRGLA